MGRVHRERAASVATGASRHRQAERSNTSYKVVFEEISQKKKKLRTYLTYDVHPPRGYTFIPAGDPQLTKRCKSYSREYGITVYIVSTGSRTTIELSKEVHRIGYHFSTFVVDKACQTLGVTLTASGRVAQSHFAYLLDDERKDRQNNARRKRLSHGRDSMKFDSSLTQHVIDAQAKDAIKDLFPKMPDRDVGEIISRAFDKTKGLVGTAEGTSLVRRANLAVVAHIRHVYTNYDELLHSGIEWADARRGVERFTLDKLVSWRGNDDDDDDDDDADMQAMLREVVVISDDEEPGSTSRGKSAYLRNGFDTETMTSGAEAIDLTEVDDEGESEEEENSVIYTTTVGTQYNHQATYDPAREARQGHERHARWEEAVNRQKQDPNQVRSTAATSSLQRIEHKPTYHPGQEPAFRPIPGLDSYNRSVAGDGPSSSTKGNTNLVAPETFLGNPNRSSSLPANKGKQSHFARLGQHDTRVDTPYAAPHHQVIRSSQVQPSTRSIPSQGNVLPSIETDQMGPPVRISDEFAHNARFEPLENERRQFNDPEFASSNSAWPNSRPLAAQKTTLVPLDDSYSVEASKLQPFRREHEALRQQIVSETSHRNDRLHDRPRQILLPQSEASQPVSRVDQSGWASPGQSGGVENAKRELHYEADPPLHALQLSASSHVHIPKLVRLPIVSEPRKQVMRVRRAENDIENSHPYDGKGMPSQYKPTLMSSNAAPYQGSSASIPDHYTMHQTSPRRLQDTANPMASQPMRQTPRLVRLGEREESKPDLSVQLQSPLSCRMVEKEARPRQIKLPMRSSFENGQIQHTYVDEGNWRQPWQRDMQPSTAMFNDQQYYYHDSPQQQQQQHPRRPPGSANDVIMLD